MQTSTDSIAARLAAVRAAMAVAARSAGRDPADVALVAVSKTRPAADVHAAITAGQYLFGENRVQEAAAKFAEVAAVSGLARLHLIGPLQTNKARDAVRVAGVIESLDRPKLLRALAEAVQREGRCPGLLVQVNVGEEPQKAGVAPSDADAFIVSCRAEFGESLSGLMGIPPAAGDPRPHFAWLRRRAEHHGLSTVSMGMSADFAVAIEEGATHIRVGSAIFGGR